MSTSTNTPSAASLGLENTNINTASGVQLDDKQKVIVGSVLDVSFILHYSTKLIHTMKLMVR
jgi:hypothetical protein